jgi:hypothetical protein
MGKLIKPAEYAKQCGISRQAVYAKIKKGLLVTKKVDGKIYIEIDSSVPLSSNSDSMTNVEEKNEVIAAKDETIKILRETIADLKKTNHLIVGTLREEVELLKEAFNEMQKLYRLHIDSIRRINLSNQILEYQDHTVEKSDFIDIKELTKELGLDKEERKKFRKIIKKMVKSNDFRFVYMENELYALKDADYSDFLEILNHFDDNEVFI